MTAGSARQPFVPVNRNSCTNAMEQLQEGYVFSVAATAGCQVDRFVHGNKYADLSIKREGIDEEITVEVHLKCTTDARPDPSKDHFSYQIKERAHFDRLARNRTKGPKQILVVMATRKDQALWTAAGADHLKVFHCCYWVSLEGMVVAETVKSPTVHVPTANVFDAEALTWILDRLDRGEPLR